MESEDKTSADVREGTPPVPANSEEPKPPAEGEKKADDRSDVNKKPTKDKCSKKHSKRKAKKGKKAASPAESSSHSDTDDSVTEASSSDDSESGAELSKTKRVVKKRQSPQKTKKRTRTKKSKKAAKTQDSSESDSASDSSESDGSDDSDDEANQQTQAELLKQLQLLILQQQQQQQQQQGGGSYGYPSGLGNSMSPPVYDTGLRRAPGRPRRGGARILGRANLGLDSSQLLDGNQHKEKKRQKASKLDYKRVDQVWDDAIHNYKLQDTAEGTVDAQYDEFIFHVRRTFDWEGKFKSTIVDIKSKLLRECLQDVIGDIKGISLVDDTPKLDPNMLFL
jgi:hypothetical protein